MSVDFTKPAATADRAQNLTDTRDTLVATAKLLDDTTPTGVASGMIRWSSTNNKFQKYNGTSWADLASTYAINVSSFNGQAASYYTNITARLGYTPVNKAGDTMTGPLVLNADPSVALGAATKGYVDTGLSGKAAAAHAHAWSSITDRLYSDGTDTGDPNSTGEPFMVTNHANGPLGAGTYFYIWTGWHGSTNYMAQVAVEVATGAPRTYTRSKTGGTWYPWVRCDLGEGLTRSIGASGYGVFPGMGGLAIRYGQLTHGGGGNVSVTFALAFPNACLAVSPNTQYNGGANNPSAHSKSASGFTCYWTGSVTITIDYIAIGY